MTLRVNPGEAISVVIQHPQLKLDPELCRRLVEHVALRERARIDALTVVLADHQTVLELNRKHLSHDYMTDVLAFDYRDDPAAQRDDKAADGDLHIDGEIFVDLDTARERYEEFGTSFQSETLRYLVHGLLHLIGYSDDSPRGKAEMRRLEDEYLEEFEPH